MKIGVLGYGEIGKAVHKLYTNCDNANLFQVYIKDLNRDDGFSNIDVLNVSIPFNDSFNFVETVSTEVKNSESKIVIVHSTVAVGTIKKLKSLLPNVAIVHSPCRGVHPNLYEGLLTFEKFVGSTCDEDTKSAIEHLSSVGVKTIACSNSETSELAKLLDTSYYGICIAYHGEAMRACEKFGANFDQVMTQYNETYNNGYTKLGKSNVVRPVLTPPQGGIGGHCVVENAELLGKQFQSTALDLILQYKRNK